MAILEPLPDCGEELRAMIDTASDREAVSLAKLFRIWEDREHRGFDIDGPGQKLTETGPHGEDITVRVYRYPEDFASGIVAVEYAPDGEQYGRILAAGFHSNNHGLSQNYQRGRARVRAWLKAHGTLQ
ncbi:MAG: hypothetical protein AAGE85_02080 [Pseudomonadota bacterium]